MFAKGGLQRDPAIVNSAVDSSEDRVVIAVEPVSTRIRTRQAPGSRRVVLVWSTERHQVGVPVLASTLVQAI